MSEYIIPAGYGEAEYVDKKSRFIGQVQYARTETEAMAFVESVRKKYADATHNVTRYFGGILLGSGGLVRAYSKAASMALEAAGRARMAEWSLVETDCGYAQYERVRRLLSDLGAEEVEASFGAEVSVSALLPLETAPLFCYRLGDVTAGSAKSRVEGSVFRPQKIFSEK